MKALDGIDLSLRRGETFGLVGETGCGKSVTANSILRLIPSPPGKIEKGMILYSVPKEKKARMVELEAEMEALRNTLSKEDMEDLGRYYASLRKIKSKERARQLRKGLSEEKGRYADLRDELQEIYRRHDLLRSSEAYMRKIRGKYISMIFQEPMSSLNPVFTAGNQIAESLLMHERSNMAQSAIGTVDERLKSLAEYKRARKLDADSGEEFQCSNCKSVVDETVDRCPECGGFFHSEPLRMVKMSSLRFYKRFLISMKKNPDSFSLKVASRIPMVKRYERLINDEALSRAEEMLKMVRIPDPANVLNSYPHELSGGMQQRVTIAMALACKPQMLIADEPTTALDVTIQAQILKIMKDLQKETGTSILLITHNLGVVAETCERVGVMYAGVMAEIGPVRSIFKEPLHPYTQGLIGSIPKLVADQVRLEIIKGNVPNLIHPPSGCRFNPRCPFAMDICRAEKPPMVEVRPGHRVSCHLYTGGAG